MFSPGPGDPTRLTETVETIKSLIGRKPILGICLGHQMFGMAMGADIIKLKFGHRGANHPVKNVITGKVSITAQNHGYAVAPEKLSSEAEVTRINLNDGTVEGLRHKTCRYSRSNTTRRRRQGRWMRGTFLRSSWSQF